MIRLYSGTPGSGKSLRACWMIRNALLAGKLVICNYPIKQPVRGWLPWTKAKGRALWITNDDLTPQRLRQEFVNYYGDRKLRESMALIVIDEAGVKFNCRDWDRAPDRREWLSFFPLHRKLGFDCLLIAQSDRMLDKQIRDMIEIETRFRRFGSFVKLPFAPPLFCGISYYHGDAKTKNAVIRRETFRYRRLYGDMYDTFLLF